jgi:enoyl-CoA hydratase/3-hydroxyacyl-CoA dehydrogenase
MGKVVILCKDRPGFVVNRFFVPWLNEACKLLDEGFGTPAEIDNVAKDCFDIGMGPFELMNLTGPSIALHSTDYLASQLQVDRYKGADSLRRLVEEGIQWDLAGVSGEFSPKDRKEIRNRLLGVVLCIASQIVEEEICAMEDVDRGAKVGLRWPMGPFELANDLGVDVAHGIASDYAVLAGFESPIILSTQGSEPFEFKLIDLEVTNGVASITFNRPEAMNALNEEVISQLTDLWKGLEADPSVHTAILRGSGKAFVAGADIKFFVDKIEDNKIDDIREFTERGHDILNAIESSRINTIAVMSGLALGGGLELAMCCNHRIGVEGKTMLRFPETGIGIYPGLGGTQRSVMIAGVECARYSIIAGNWLDSNLAFSMGYLTDVVDYSGLEKAISDIANGKVDHPSHRYLPSNPEDALIKQIMEVYGDDWQSRLMGPSSELNPFEVRQSKFIGRNAPVSIKMASELIDIANKSREDPTAGLQSELDGLDTIFSTKDALMGLKGVLSGERVQFSGE